jgi:hypothetical protein
MTIFGKTLSDYVRFSKPFLVLIAVVGVARLALSLGGVPNSAARWLSISAVLWIGVLYFSIRAHTTGFGSYLSLLPIFVLQSLVAQAVIITGIIIAIVTGVDNIFSAPEYSFGGDGKTWFHVGAHLVLGTTIGSLIGWLVGCVIMFVTKKTATGGKGSSAEARA